MTAVLPTREENHRVSTPIGHQLDSHDLWRWVDRLTRDRREKLTRSVLGGKPWTEWVDVPALWTQLVEDMAATSSGGAGRVTTSGSRLPLNADKLALMVDIAGYVAGQLSTRGHEPRLLADTAVARQPLATPRLLDDTGKPLYAPDVAGQLVERAARTASTERGRRDAALLRHDTRSDLRRLATIVVGEHDQRAVDRLTSCYRSFASRVEVALTGEDESVDLRGARGHACPVCLTVWVTYERDGEQFRDPALVIALRDGQVQHITCRSCGTGWWRGDDVQMLTDQITENENVYGDARVWGDTKPGRIGA